MLYRVIAVGVAALLGCPACAGSTDLSSPEPDLLVTPRPTVAPLRPDDGGGACNRAAEGAGAEVWRRTLSEADVLAHTSVASDRATGAGYVARSAGETSRLDPNGGVVWETELGSLVSPDGKGGVYVSGTFSGSVDLGAQTLSSVGGTDVYVARLDPDGGVIAATRLGGAGDDAAVGIATDQRGDVIVSGPGIGTVKLSDAGGVVWEREFFGRLAVDSEDAVLLTGALTGTMRFGEATLTSQGGEDVFVVKLDAAGNKLFARGFGDAGASQRGEAIAAAPNGDVLVSGVIDGRVDFGGGALGVDPGTCPEESWCMLAGFVLALDRTGEHAWSLARAPVRSFPGIAVDSCGNVLVSGASPGNAPPYRLPLLLRFDATGAEVPLSPGFDVADFGGGAGHGVAFDAMGGALWALVVAPSPTMPEVSVVVKLAL